MSTKTKRKSNVTYWKTTPDYTWYVLDELRRTPTKIGAFHTLEVSYNYNCPDNTYLSSATPVRVSKEAFMSKMRYLQAKYGVKFSIKTEWGTNENN